MKSSCTWLSLLLVLVLSPGMPAFCEEDGAVTEVIRQKVEQIRLSGDQKVYGAWIASRSVLPVLYEKRDFRPIWTHSAAVEQLISAVEDSFEDGLNPLDYHYKELLELRSRIEQGGSAAPELLAAFDLLLTDSLVRLGYHLMFGKEDPVTHHPHWNLTENIDNADPAVMLRDMVESCAVKPLMNDCMPRHPVYTRMKSVLASYRDLQDGGGWESVGDGPTLEKGAEGERVLALRRRLATTGDLSREASGSPVFDDELVQAVTRFQTRHHLQVDGKVGKKTLYALNVPVAQRIEQIRIALERIRWVIRGVPKTFVVVDIARFEATFYRNNEQVWHGRAQVGKSYRQTPVFRADLKYLVFNPTWTIPPTIRSKDILPAVREDPGYLEARNIQVLDADGQVVDSNAIDWTQYAGRDFPYMLRQAPGANNALGLVKFIFPNPHHVYIHDTPSKSLFGRQNRAFSSGCIRVEEPLALAEHLLNDQARWSRDKIDSAIEAGATETVLLPAPVPVLLLYSTVWAEDDGTAHFTEDIYRRDPSVLEGLDSGFTAAQSVNGSRPAL